MSAAPGAVLLVSHGTVDRLEDLRAFTTNVRRGRPPSDELVAELTHRYEAIGGRSPLNAINAELARKLEARLRRPVAWANRLWRPTVREGLERLLAEGATTVALVPLAQHSGPVYAEDARRAAEGLALALRCAPSWGDRGDLHAAFATRILEAVEAGPREGTTVVMTAHSLPRAVVERGDPYERDVRAAAGDIGDRLGGVPWKVAFQSQGLSDGLGAWLGPDLASTLDAARSEGATRVVFAPVGFLADHVEILYDLDVEAASMARQRGLAPARSRSLNAEDDLVEILAQVALPLLGEG